MEYGFGKFQGAVGAFTRPGMGDWGTTLSGLVTAAAPILQQYLGSRASATPSFLPSLSNQPLLGPNIFGSMTNALLGTGGATAGASDLFGTPTERVRPMRHVPVTGPDGRLYWFGYLGKPVLWGGDLSAARRVQRVARRAARGTVRRRSVRRLPRTIRT